VVGHPKARERLYISRGKAAHRKVINEAEIEAYLHSLGFESVLLEALTVAEQASTLHSARVVVAPHGAGLTNLVFCRPDTIVIEMFSPSYINCCYWALSNWVDAQYYFLLGSGGRDREDLFALGEDIVVEVDVLEEILKLTGLE
jgi:capsular polysaccharide biosynthesis protein